MRFYTKEWYEFRQKIDYTCGISKIPSKDYTDKEIRELYDSQLRNRIAEEKEFYDEPPFFLITAEELDEETFCPEDWIEVIEDRGKYRENVSFEEVKAMLMFEEETAMKEYENRPPFDSTKVVENFEEVYGYNLKDCINRFPEWVTSRVDARILALDLMPQDVYTQLKKEEKRNRKVLEKLERKAERELKRYLSQIPQKVYEILQCHDSFIISLEEKDKNVTMRLNKNEISTEDEEFYDKIVFREVEVFQYEKEMKISCCKQDEKYISNCTYLEYELYRTEQGRLEYHLMVMNEELRYITIRCKKIESE